MSQRIFERILVVGGGLIGTSLLHSIREEGLASNCYLVDRRTDVLDVARELKLADDYGTDVASFAHLADLIVIATPIGQVADVSRALATSITPRAIVIDVCSAKSEVIAMMTSSLQGRGLVVPCHPIAGTEESGPRAGFAGLFQDRWCIITPLDDDSSEYAGALQKVKDFWRLLGSTTSIMTPEQHDLVLAITSHIPHLIAYSIVGTAKDYEKVSTSEVIEYSAGGFRDFTRIAASDPVMWRDVFLHNRPAVLEMLGRFIEDLMRLQQAIRSGDGDYLLEKFSETRAIRKEIIEAGQDSRARNFGRNE